MNEIKAQLLNLLKKRWTLPVATGVTGLGVGTSVTYFVTKKRFGKKLDEVSMESEYRQVQLEQQNRIVHELREQLREAIIRAESKVEVVPNPEANATGVPMTPLPKRVNYSEPLGEVTEIKETGDGLEVEFEANSDENARVIRNIFDTAGDEWDYKTEIETRDRSRPYVIHVDEYLADEKGYDNQVTLTWYEQDSVLYDDARGIPIYNPQAVVGELRFGHGSNDPNVVFIRNEQNQTEYEVLRDTGSYQLTILGEELEEEQEQQDLKHSANHKFRSD